MKRGLTYLGVLFALLVTAPVHAATAGAQNWTGFYIGGHIGATGGDFNNRPLVIGPTGESGDISGGFLGGYNWQRGNWVFGAEADYSQIDVSASSATSGFEEDWTISFRGRAGYVVDRFLPYVTVGVGITEVTAKITASGERSTSVAGVTAGAGVETFLNGNWFGRVEYLYTDVPETTQTVGASVVTGGSDNHTGRVAVGYRF